MNMVAIREANSSDLQFLNQIVDLFDRRDDPAALRGWSAEDDATLIAELDAGPIGAAWLRPHRRPRNREVYVGVTPELQGTGVATRLLDELVRRAVKDRRTDTLVARVNPANEAALRLFHRAGFVSESGWTWTLELRRERDLPEGNA